MSRVTTGSAKGRNLKVPNKIKDIRVPQDVFKLALFSILGEKINNAVCLDLYAGSGSLGIEALSRGAKLCHFVDKHRNAYETILENLNVCKLDKKGEVFQDDSTKFAANADKIYDVIFLDPFYDDTKHKFLMQNLEEILKDGGVIAFSHGNELDIEETISNTNLEVFTQRRFGNAYLTVLRSS